MKTLAVFFGGKTAEHDVSIVTGTQLIENVDKTKYNILPVYISRNGEWYAGQELGNISFYQKKEVYISPKERVFLDVSGGEGLLMKSTRFGVKSVGKIDVALIAMHGLNGEDGTLSGLFELANIPYTASSVVGSAVGMDKIVMRAAFRGLGFPVPEDISFERREFIVSSEQIVKRVEKSLRYPVFVKPANLGSSIGISKAVDAESLKEAIEIASSYDRRIIVENGIESLMEVNCAVLGFGSRATASLIEEPIAWEEFLSFEDKYLRGSGGKGMSTLARRIPADIPKDIQSEVTRISLEAFAALDMKGVVRFDFLIDKELGKLYLNEVNTIPGSFAYYLFEPAGITFPRLIDQLIDSAFEAFEEKGKNSFAYDSTILQTVAFGSKGSKGAKR